MPKGKKGKGKGRGKGPAQKKSAIDVNVDFSSDEDTEVESRQGKAATKPPVEEVEVEDVTACSQGSGGSQRSGKRDYHKAELSVDQEGELMEWFKENECLYDRRHRDNMNTKHKNVLKQEQAAKMNITGEYCGC